jgi:hypothetical protein
VVAYGEAEMEGGEIGYFLLIFLVGCFFDTLVAGVGSVGYLYHGSTRILQYVSMCILYYVDGCSNNVSFYSKLDRLS